MIKEVQSLKNELETGSIKLDKNDGDMEPVGNHSKFLDGDEDIKDFFRVKINL